MSKKIKNIVYKYNDLRLDWNGESFDLNQSHEVSSRDMRELLKCLNALSHEDSLKLVDNVKIFRGY